MTTAQANAAKAVASFIAALIALLAHALGWSPELASQYFLDLVTSAVMSLAGIYYAVRNRDDQPAA